MTQDLPAIKPVYTQEEVTNITKQIGKKEIPLPWIAKVICNTNFVPVLKEVTECYKARLKHNEALFKSSTQALEKLSEDTIAGLVLVADNATSDDTLIEVAREIRSYSIELAKIIAEMQKESKKFSWGDIFFWCGISFVGGSLLTLAAVSHKKKAS